MSPCVDTQPFGEDYQSKGRFVPIWVNYLMKSDRKRRA